MAVQTQRAIGLFRTYDEARSALYQLRDAGFNMDKVSIIANNPAGDASMAGATVEKSKSEQASGGAGAGAVAGTATGGLMGLFGSLGVLAIPGVGPIAEVGIVLANTLLGGGIGAAGGGLLGALIGWGVPEDRANYYNTQVFENNEYLVVVDGTEQEIRNAETVLNNYGLHDWGVYTPRDRHAGTRR
ncbi:MAG: general stress protein [Elainellaceae cyanobacterium]